MKQIYKKLRKPRIGTVGKAILVAIAVTGAVSMFAMLPGMAYVLAPFIKRKRQPRRQIIEKSVETLVSAGLVRRILSADGTIQLELTRKGKWEALLRFKSVDRKKEKWDNLWRVVIFDVPKEKNKMRHELRRAMKLYGFKMLQQSVWVYPHDCEDLIALLKTDLRIGKDVLYMIVESIENDGHIRRHFSV